MNPFALLALIPLGVAAVHDWRTRHAPNAVWAWLAVIGLGSVFEATTFYPLGTGLLGSGLGLAMWRLTRLGGADAKAIMLSGFVLPNPLAFLGAVLAALVGSLAWKAVRGRGDPAPYLVAHYAAFSVPLLWVGFHSHTGFDLGVWGL